MHNYITIKKQSIQQLKPTKNTVKLAAGRMLLLVKKNKAAKAAGNIQEAMKKAR